MRLEIDKVITLDNNLKYLILSEVYYMSEYYYYVALVKADETDIEEDYKIISLKQSGNDMAIVDITEEQKLREVLPLFLEQIKE